MPRRTVPFFSGYHYHLYNRGNNRQPVFYERDNYLYFLSGMRKYLLESVDILAYVLMPTHYHLLVQVRPQTLNPQTSEVSNLQTSEVSETSEVSVTEVSEAEVSAAEVSAETSRAVSHAIQMLTISYTKAVNKRYERVGSLFQGQFQAKLVKNDAQLQALCVYIHANPVKDGLVELPEDWEYSNYLEWMNLRNGNLVSRAFIKNHIGSPKEYRQLVMGYLKSRTLPDLDL